VGERFLLEEIWMSTSNNRSTEEEEIRDLIVSTSMLEYVARPDLSQALSVLGARLARHGTLLVVITRKNWVTRVLIERWWQAARYSREELREAFAIAGFRSLVFSRFPYRYCWHSLPNHVAGWIAPVVTGLVVDKTGRFFWAFIITAVIALLGSLSWIFIVGALRQVDWSTRPAYADSR
jgi:hypothetical protein